MAPHSINSMRLSVTISVWTPRSFLPFKKPNIACGMRPMPNSMVEPSSTSAAMYSAICRVVSVTSGAGTSRIGAADGTSTSMSLTWMKQSPSVRGMFGLTCAMTSEAFSVALFTMSTDTPRLHMPYWSGGVT